MTGPQLISLSAAMPGLQAEEALRDHTIHAFDPETVYRLVLAATGSKEEADTARCSRMSAIMAEASKRNQ
jgi:hypothetical protein